MLRSTGDIFRSTGEKLRSTGEKAWSTTSDKARTAGDKIWSATNEKVQSAGGVLSATGYTRLSKTQRYGAAGVATAGVAALTLTLVPGVSGADDGNAQAAKSKAAQTEAASFKSQDRVASSQGQSVKQQKDAAQKRADAEKKAEQDRSKSEASRSEKRSDVKSYPNNLDGWIREAKDIMKSKKIPGSYDGIKRNIMRESGGNPNISNDWDVNAQKGTPSKGLLQVIQPTFDQYHVKGTSKKLTDPVANIVAACNYAADRYGSMDNVDSAY